MSGSFVDADVLDATRQKLSALAGDLPALLSRADALDVGPEVAALRPLTGWAESTSGDLRTRVQLIHKMESGDVSLSGTGLTGAELRAVAGGRQSVAESMNVLALLPDLKRLGFGKDGLLDWGESKNFSDWIDNIKNRAVAKLPYGDELNNILEFKSNLEAIPGDLGTIWASLKHGPKLLSVIRGNEQSFKAPESLSKLQKWVVDKILPEGKFEDILSRVSSNDRVAQFLADNPWARQGADKLSDFAKSPLMGRLSQASSAVFGKPWTNAAGETFERGSTNLLKVLGETGRLSEVGKVAGGLRVLGVAGSAFATVDSGIGLYNEISSGELSKKWSEGGTKGKAGVIGDVAEVAFNGSMTAMMVAPTPWTVGAVAVTGLVYGGARLVEHWDDVTEGLSKAKDWAGDRLDDAEDWAGDRVDDVKDFASDTADDVKDMAGDAVDAVKDSPINPGNWF